MNEVLQFISQFDGAQDVFLYGCCYWFAHILHNRFNGEILYEPVEGHFVTRIANGLYDIRGEVTEQYKECGLIDWDTYAEVDPLHYKHIVRDCVMKEVVEFD